MGSLRPVFASTLTKFGSKDKDLVVVVGDISHGILGGFRNEFPNRYFNIGICEPATIGVAAGLSYSGLTPVVHTIAPFLIERSYEQIKLDFGYQNLPGNFISVGSSFDYSKLGCSHHSYADVSLIAHLPKGRVFMPGSPIEFEVLFEKAYKQDYINYFRLTENSHDIEFKREQIEIGEAIQVVEGTDLSLITIGSQLKNCVEAATKLKSRGVSVEVIYLPTFKPFDSIKVRRSIEKTRSFITVEELSSQDGLYNAVLRSVLGIDRLIGKQMAVFEFIRAYGNYTELQNEAGLSEKHIIANIELLLSKKTN
jgi:transketolase